MSTTYITIVSKAALLTYASYAHTLNKIGPFCECIPVYPVLTLEHTTAAALRDGAWHNALNTYDCTVLSYYVSPFVKQIL